MSFHGINPFCTKSKLPREIPVAVDMIDPNCIDRVCTLTLSLLLRQLENEVCGHFISIAHACIQPVFIILAALAVFSQGIAVPRVTLANEIDDMIARKRLEAWNIEIDELTEEQEKYLKSWQV